MATQNRSLLCWCAGSYAGLNDRIAVIRPLATLAIALDASLQLARPCKLLDPKHNHNRPVSCDYTWSRYLEVKHNGRAFALDDHPCCTDRRLLPAPIVKLSREQLLSYSGPRPFVVEPRYWEGLYEAHFLPAAPHMTQPELTFSRYVCQAALALLSRLGVDGEFGSMHIRRGDVLSQCDSSTHRVADAVGNLSIALPVLFHTQEAATSAYVHEVQRLRPRMHHLDPMLDQLHPDDNFMVFAIERQVEAFASVQVTFRAGLCPSVVFHHPAARQCTQLTEVAHTRRS